VSDSALRSRTGRDVTHERLESARRACDVVRAMLTKLGV
jgi:hypothetical protein